MQQKMSAYVCHAGPLVNKREITLDTVGRATSPCQSFRPENVLAEPSSCAKDQERRAAKAETEHREPTLLCSNEGRKRNYVNKIATSDTPIKCETSICTVTDCCVQQCADVLDDGTLENPGICTEDFVKSKDFQSIKCKTTKCTVKECCVKKKKCNTIDFQIECPTTHNRVGNYNFHNCVEDTCKVDDCCVLKEKCEGKKNFGRYLCSTILNVLIHVMNLF